MLEVIFAEGLEDRDAIERQATRHPRAARGSSPSIRPRRPRRAAACRPATCASWRATSPAPSAPPSTGAPAPAWGATGRWSRSCSTRSTSSPATSTARAARCSATRRSTSAAIADLAGLATLRQGPLARRRPARGARLAARVGDGEGDDHAGRGADPGDVLLRRQPGALGAQRPRARGRDRGRRALGRDRPLRHRHGAALRLRAAGDDDVRARGLPAAVPGPVQHPVRPDDRGGRRAARRGAPGVGGDRGRSRAGSASSRRACGRRGCSARSGSGSRPTRLVDLLLRAGPKGDLFGLRRGGLSVAKLARNPHGIVLAEHLAPGRAAQADPPPHRARAPRPARRSSRTPSAWRSATATTPTSRCA